ncbi:MAG: hypothetical protein ACRDT4_11700 [Micromonosporaceae bacterium]
MQHVGQVAERVEYRVSTWAYIKTNLVVLAGFAGFFSLLTVGSGALVDWLIGYPRPIDYWDLVLQPGIVLGIGVPTVLILAWVMARKRQFTVLAPLGLDHPPQGVFARRGFLPWPAVVGVDVIQAGFTKLIGVRLVDNRTVRVAPPYGFRRTAELTAALGTFRDYAQRYGGRVDAPVRSKGTVALIVLLVIVGLAAVLGLIRLATAPIIPPWAPYASALPDACQALERAGLDTHWPKAQREQESTSPGAYQGDERKCEVTETGDASAPYSTVTVVVTSYHDSVLTTGPKRAYEDVSFNQRYQDAVRPVALGDVGVRFEPYHGAVRVEVCRGNVVVGVELDGGEHHDPEAAGRVAETLAAGILKQFRLD